MRFFFVATYVCMYRLVARPCHGIVFVVVGMKEAKKKYECDEPYRMQSQGAAAVTTQEKCKNKM